MKFRIMKKTKIETLKTGNRTFLRSTLALVLLVFLSAALLNAQEARKVQKINDAWRFCLGDIMAASEYEFDDSGWRILDLPHDWSIEQEFNIRYASATAFLPGGIGWYRKSIEIPESYKGKDISLMFDGIYNNSEVWINGHYLGKRPNGFVSFSYDITPYILYGERNVIAVRVDRMKFADTRWYSGSGIYRSVWLITTSMIHVAQWGTFVTTPNVSEKLAGVNVKTELINSSRNEQPVKIELSVMDQLSIVVATVSENLILKDSLTTVNHVLSLKNPKLWSTENPALYSLKTSIWIDGNPVDEIITPFGIRTLHFDSNTGFFLNGKNMKIKGVCLHHDGGCVGVAVPDKIWEIRLGKLKAAGCNAIRTSHNPVSAEFLDICDRMGFLVMEEAFDEWEFPKRKWVDGWNNTISTYEGYAQYFMDWAEKDLHDMVDRDKNHPSIIMWSIGNEIDYGNDPYADPESPNYDFSRPDPARMLGITKTLKAVVKQVDNTRLVTMALADVKNSLNVGLPDLLDVIGYNYTESRYPEDHATYPDRVIYGSENPHNYSGWLAVKNNDYMCSQFLWTGIDYLGESAKFPNRSAYSGLLDLTNHEKTIYYWRQSMWSDKPMVSLAARKVRPGDSENTDPMGKLDWFLSAIAEKLYWNYSQGDTVLVIAYSNSQEVELFLNNKSLGKKKSIEANSCFWWLVPYAPGEVKALAYNKGMKPLESVLHTEFEPVRMVAKADAPVIKADKDDIAIIEVQLLDKNGNNTYMAKNKIEFTVEGEGRIIGTDNGDATCQDNLKLPWRNAFAGRCIAVVQSNGKKGKINVVIRSEGLGDERVVIDAL
jgi:beta-galactosidase